MKFIVFFLALSLTTPAFAQQQTTPSEVAIQINNAVSSLALALENANRQLKDLTDKNAALQKQLDELKAKQ